MAPHLFAFASTVRRMHEGPLGPHVDEFTAFLQKRGHRLSAVRDRIRLIADLSRWLDRRNLRVTDLMRESIENFLRQRWRRMGHRRGERGRLEAFLGYLITKGVLLTQSPPITSHPSHPLAPAFASYLQNERALSRATLVNYLPFVSRFLEECRSPFRADRIVRFILSQIRSMSPGRAKLLVTALRSFFRFLRLRGEISTDLAACVPTVPDWRLTTLPKSIQPKEVERVLGACNPQRPAGLRDYAILLLLARLGLRAGEIVALTLEDLHWEVGEITVRGKGSRPHRLPLPHDVGKALVAYLRHGRPRGCASRKVFVQAYPPYTGLASSPTVSTLVRRAITRAGLRPPRMGAHLFRHSLATHMLRRGAKLSEIGQVLRHRHPDTTAIYAKVDVDRLRPLAQRWPGGKS